MPSETKVPMPEHLTDEALRRMYALRDEVWKSARGSEDVDVGEAMVACRSAIEAIASERDAFWMAKVAELAEGLRNLLDEQNGPPLIRHAASWQAAVDRGEELYHEAATLTNPRAGETA